MLRALAHHHRTHGLRLRRRPEPLDIALVLLLLRQCTSTEVQPVSSAWFVINSVAMRRWSRSAGLTLSMEKGGIHQVGMISRRRRSSPGIRELDPNPKISKAAGLPSWKSRAASPRSAATDRTTDLLLSPDNLFLLAKEHPSSKGTPWPTAGGWLNRHLSWISTLLLVPILLVLVRKQQVQPLLEKGK